MLIIQSEEMDNRFAHYILCIYYEKYLRNSERATRRTFALAAHKPAGGGFFQERK